MDTFKAAALAILLARIGEPARAESFPAGDVFRPLVANPEGLKKSGLQAGIDYARATPVLFGARLVGGLDIKWFEETDWRAGISGKVGLEFGRPRPERRGITLLLEAYDGPAPFGQYCRHNISYYGAGVQFDL